MKKMALSSIRLSADAVINLKPYNNILTFTLKNLSNY